MVNQSSLKMVFTVSADEVQRFKEPAVDSLISIPVEVETHFSQWVAHNVDHNIATFMVKRIFHSMRVTPVACFAKNFIHVVQ